MRWAYSMILLVFLGLLAASPVVAMGAESTPVYGGQLVVAMPAEPSHFDMHKSTLNYGRYIAWHVNEQLFAVDANFQPTPMLAKSYTVSEDGLIYTILLREGVLFHNLKEMTSEDVVASLQRTVALKSLIGAAKIKEVRATGKYSIEIELSEPMGSLIFALSEVRKGAAIYPKETIDAVGTTGIITDYIGTGPYTFAEWRKAQYVLLKRFDQYSARAEEPNGYGGGKTAYLDEIKFMFVSEPSVRAIGIQAGDFHFAWPLTADDNARLRNDSNVVSLVSAPFYLTVILSNASTVGLSGNREFRRAVQAAVDCEEIMAGLFGDPQIWRLDPGFMWIETAWHSDVGIELYNQANPQKAREILAAMGYNGEPVRMITSSEEAVILNSCLILKQQLEAAGINIVLETYDMATSKNVQKDPNAWDICTLDSTYRSHPLSLTSIYASATTAWSLPEKDVLVNALMSEADPVKAFEIWEEIQGLFYSEVPLVKVGDYFDYIGMSADVQGYMNTPEYFFWNVWLSNSD